MLLKGRGGVFNVTVGNELLFSKGEEGRFPSEQEIVEKIRSIPRLA